MIRKISLPDTCAEVACETYKCHIRNCAYYYETASPDELYNEKKCAHAYHDRPGVRSSPDAVEELMKD